MRNDWIFDAVHAEVMYRTEQLARAGQGYQPKRRRRWRLGSRAPEVVVPEPRRPAGDEAVLPRARAR
jgi:hypothetical protein